MYLLAQEIQGTELGPQETGSQGDGLGRGRYARNGHLSLRALGTRLEGDIESPAE